MIVHCTIQFATQETEVIAVTDNTDVLIILTHDWQNDICLLSVTIKQNVEVLED